MKSASFSPRFRRTSHPKRAQGHLESARVSQIHLFLSSIFCRQFISRTSSVFNPTVELQTGQGFRFSFEASLQIIELKASRGEDRHFFITVVKKDRIPQHMLTWRPGQASSSDPKGFGEIDAHFGLIPARAATQFAPRIDEKTTAPTDPFASLAPFLASEEGVQRAAQTPPPRKLFSIVWF